MEHFSRQYSTKAPGTQQRREPRTDIEKRLPADISDGINSFTGTVANISRMGLCINDLPETMSVSSELVSVVIRKGADELQLVGRPCWQYLQHPKRKTIGLKITSSHVDWNAFIFTR